MPRARLASPLIVKISAACALAALAAIAACTGVEGVTPTCTFNLGGSGVVPSADGCEQFAPCLDKNGNAQDASKCCVDKNGTALTGCDLFVCLYSYGTKPDPTLCPSMSSTSSSSGGIGGSGGAL
jgi:hypothetical protein